MSHRFAAAAIYCALVLPFGAAQAAQQAGVAAVVVGDVSVEPDGAAAKSAAAGMGINLGDRVTSQESSRMQVLLLDETVFTVGPRSDLVIDRFVYDPNSNAGELAASVGRGVFRYVSGKIAKNQPQAVSIRTPTALIGIRGTAMFGAPDPETGGMFYGLVGPGPRNNADLNPGGFTYTGDNGDQRDVSRSGYGVLDVDGVVGPVIRTPARIIDSLQRSLTATVPGTGQPSGRSGDGVESASKESGQATAESQATATSIGQIVAGATAADMVSSEAAADGATNEQEEIDRLIRTTSETAQNTFSGRLPFGVNIPYAFEASWDTISDLDLHVTGPLGSSSSDGRFHVFFSNVGSFDSSPFAVLDADRTFISGTTRNSEVVGISQLQTGGNYVASVFNFSNSSSGSTSLSNQANLIMRMIQNGQISRGSGGSVIVNGTVLGSVTAPTGQSGNTYVGFTFDPVTKTVTTTNTFTNFSGSSSVE